LNQGCTRYARALGREIDAGADGDLGCDRGVDVRDREARGGDELFDL